MVERKVRYLMQYAHWADVPIPPAKCGKSWLSATAREEDLESVLARLKESKYLPDLWEPRLGNLVQRRTSGGDGQDCQVEWGAANDQTASQCVCRKDHFSA